MIMKFVYHDREETEGHFCFIDDYTNGYFRCINFTENNKLSYVKESEIKNCLSLIVGSGSQDLINYYPYVWFLSKE